jgi:hypothetical protein
MTKPGDVDAFGNIVISETTSLYMGVVYVSRVQAKRARDYGWEEIGRQDELVIIRRQHGQARLADGRLKWLRGK